MIQLIVIPDIPGAPAPITNWKRSPSLVLRRDTYCIAIVSARLTLIAKPNSEAKQRYSLWDGAKRRAHAFGNAFWRPTWKS
jgi:hypothetical protein